MVTEPKELEEWEREEKTVTLTRGQWYMLTTFLVMTANYRVKEAESWESFIGEMNEDGSPMFAQASENAKFWRRMIEEIDLIKFMIDGF